MEFVAEDEHGLQDIAQTLKNEFPNERIFALEGDLGSGKTSFVKAFVKVLGIAEAVSSPTFSIVQEYGQGANKVYHFDLYRLKNELELLQIGFEEYIDSGCYVFIEWPGIAKNLLPRGIVNLRFEVWGANSRKIICGIGNT